MGSVGLDPVGGVAAVEGKSGPLALLNQQGVHVTVLGTAASGGAGL